MFEWYVVGKVTEMLTITEEKFLPPIYCIYMWVEFNKDSYTWHLNSLKNDCQKDMYDYLQATRLRIILNHMDFWE